MGRLDTKSIETKKKASKILRQTRYIIFKISLIVWGTRPWIRIRSKNRVGNTETLLCIGTLRTMRTMPFDYNLHES